MTQPPDAAVEDSGGGDGFDGAVSFPVMPDADLPIPGDPPPELAGHRCAVDTNKLYDVVTLDRPAVTTQLGVDLAASIFSAAFVGDSDQCVDAVYLVSLAGPSGVGEPEIELVADECTTVLQTAVTRVDDHWLVASVDARMDMYDIWVHARDADGELGVQRATETPALETDVVIAPVGDGAAFVAWVEADMLTGISTLNALPLTAEGEPAGDPVVVEESDVWTYTSLSLGGLGGEFAALGYRRYDATGRSEIVLDVLDAATGERDHDSWVMTTDAGPFGSIELGTDEEGGGVIYSLGQGESSQIWFQLIDRTGGPAAVMNGLLVGGPAEPQRIVAPPSNAIDASMAKLPVGFAVAYRALPGLTLDDPRIRVHFLDRQGRIIGQSDVALASEFGGRTAIESAYDGRIVLGWSDTAEDGTSTLTVVKLPCVGGN